MLMAYVLIAKMRAMTDNTVMCNYCGNTVDVLDYDQIDEVCDDCARYSAYCISCDTYTHEQQLVEGVCEWCRSRH